MDQFSSIKQEEELTPEERKIRAVRFDPYKELKDYYFLKAKAPSTVDQYLGAFERVKAWAKGMNIPVLPMSSDNLIVYLIHNSEKLESYASVKMSVYGIAYVHQMAGLQDPSKDPAVNLVLQAAKRMWAHPVKKAEPMTLFIIKMLVDKILGNDILRSKGNFKVSIVEWRTVINIVIKFCFIARSADVIELTRENFKFVKDLLIIHFPKSKNDQFFEGSSTLFEGQKGKKYCPIFLAQKYFERLGYDESSKGFFLPKTVMKKVKVNGKMVSRQVAKPHEHVSYNTCLYDRRKVLQKLGLVAKNYTEHSDRVGGATHCFNEGASLDEVQTHGRWKTAITPFKYIQKSEEKRKAISKLYFKKD